MLRNFLSVSFFSCSFLAFGQPSNQFVMGPSVPIPTGNPSQYTSPEGVSADFNLDLLPDLFLPNSDLAVSFFGSSNNLQLGKVLIVNPQGTSFSTPTATFSQIPLGSFGAPSIFSGVASLAAGNLDIPAPGPNVPPPFPDIVGTTKQGVIFRSLNLGQTAYENGFHGTTGVVEDLSSITASLSTSCQSQLNENFQTKLIDLNNDQILDILVFGAASCFFSQQSENLPLVIAYGLGDGNFQIPTEKVPQLSANLPPNNPSGQNAFPLAPTDKPQALDAKFVDLDFDGLPETIAILSRSIVNPYGAFGWSNTFLEFFQNLGGTGWVATERHQLLGASGIPTDLEFGDLTGDGLPDWVVTYSLPQGSTSTGQPAITSHVFAFSGTGQTPFSFSQAGFNLGVPGGPPTAYEFFGTRLIDLNGDNVQDFATLVAFGSSSYAKFVYSIMTPGVGLGPMEELVMNGFLGFPNGGKNQIMAGIANFPEALAVADVGFDSLPNFFVSGISSTPAGGGGTTSLSVVSILNTAAPGSGLNPTLALHHGDGRQNWANRTLFTGLSGKPSVSGGDFWVVANDLPGNNTFVGLAGATYPIAPMPVSIGGPWTLETAVENAWQFTMTHSGNSGGLASLRMPMSTFPNPAAIIGYELWFQFAYVDMNTGLIYDTVPLYLRMGP